MFDAFTLYFEWLWRIGISIAVFCILYAQINWQKRTTQIYHYIAGVERRTMFLHMSTRSMVRELQGVTRGMGSRIGQEYPTIEVELAELANQEGQNQA